MMAAILSGHLQWFFSMLFYFWVFLRRHRCWWAIFIKLQATVFPAASRQWHLRYLGAAVLQGIFSRYFLLSFIIKFILLSTSVQSLCTRLGFLQLAHRNITIVSGFVFLFFITQGLSTLISLLCYYLLIYPILFNYRSH